MNRKALLSTLVVMVGLSLMLFGTANARNERQLQINPSDPCVRRCVEGLKTCENLCGSNSPCRESCQGGNSECLKKCPSSPTSQVDFFEDIILACTSFDKTTE
jgi:hypothetical protein